jgi:hypothetical protein
MDELSLESHTKQMDDAKRDVDAPPRKAKKKRDKKNKSRTMAPPSMVPPSMQPPPLASAAPAKEREVDSDRLRVSYDGSKGEAVGAMTSYDLDAENFQALASAPKDDSFDGNEEVLTGDKGAPLSPEASGTKGEYVLPPTQEPPLEEEELALSSSPSPSRLGSAGPLPGGGFAQSRARVLAQQRELQMKRRQQSMSGNQAMMRSTEGSPRGVTPAMRQFGASVNASGEEDAFGGSSGGASNGGGGDYDGALYQSGNSRDGPLLASAGLQSHLVRGMVESDDRDLRAGAEGPHQLPGPRSNGGDGPLNGG